MNTRGLRYAALRMATLHPADRAWLLECLPFAAAEALRSLGRTPGLDRMAAVAAHLDLPVNREAEGPREAAPLPAPRIPAAVEGLDLIWAQLWQSVASNDPDSAVLPARFKGAVKRWTPPGGTEL